MRQEIFTVQGDLDIDSVYTKALESRQVLDEKLSQLANAKERKRVLDNQISDLEMEIAGRERGAEPTMSATAMEKHLKMVLHSDMAWQSMRASATGLASEIEALEFDKSVLTRDIEISCARMNSLGGKYVYLAAERVGDILPA